MVSLNHYLLLCGICFSIGLFGILKRRNILMLFFATGILLNSINIGFVAIASYLNDLQGEIFALFIIAIAAAEIAVGLGLVVIWYRKHRTLDISTIENLKG